MKGREGWPILEAYRFPLNWYRLRIQEWKGHENWPILKAFRCSTKGQPKKFVIWQWWCHLLTGVGLSDRVGKICISKEKNGRKKGKTRPNLQEKWAIIYLDEGIDLLKMPLNILWNLSGGVFKIRGQFSVERMSVHVHGAVYKNQWLCWEMTIIKAPPPCPFAFMYFNIYNLIRTSSYCALFNLHVA